MPARYDDRCQGKLNTSIDCINKPSNSGQHAPRRQQGASIVVVVDVESVAGTRDRGERVP